MKVFGYKPKAVGEKIAVAEPSLSSVGKAQKHELWGSVIVQIVATISVNWPL